ncbi:MAG: YdbH domain-containing protein [Gammaproteobacteria bacterium]
MKKLFLIIFIAFIVVALFLFRVPLIQVLAPNIAKYYGFDVSNVEVAQIDIDKIVIPVLGMQYAKAGKQVDIEMHNLVVIIDQYQRVISEVSSSRVVIEIDQIEELVTATPDTSINDAINFLPIFGINIEHLELKYRAQEKQLASFKGELLYADTMQLKGNFSIQEMLDFNVTMTADESDFIIDVSQHDQENNNEVIALSGDYWVKDDWLKVTLAGRLSIADINNMLHGFGMNKFVQDDDSAVKAKFELDLARSAEQIMQSFAADIDIDSSLKVSAHELSVKFADVDISASCHVEKTDMANCAFKDPQRAVIDFHSPPDWLSNYFEEIDSQYIVEVNPSDQLELQLSFMEILAAKAIGSAAFNMRSRSSRFNVDGLLYDLSFNGVEQDWQLDAGYQMKLNALNVDAPIEVPRFILMANGNLSANQTWLDISVAKDSVATALDVAYEGYLTKKLEFKQLDDALIRYRYQNNNVYADSLDFSLTSRQVKHEDFEVDLSPIQLSVENLDYSNNKQSLVAKLVTDHVLVTQRGIPISAYGIEAGAEYKDEQLSMSGNAGFGEQKNRLEYSATHDFVKGLGTGTITGEATKLADNEIISRQISDSGFPLQLREGGLKIDIEALWNTNKSISEITVKLLADNIAGDYAQNQFSGLNTSLEFIGHEGWSLKQAASINIDIVNMGVPLKDLTLNLERMEYEVQEHPLIVLRDLSAAALDGSIYSNKIEVDLNRRENKFSIFLSSLSLEKLVALNQTEDLIASGTLNGELPMRLDNGVLLVDGGWLRADERGGFIKYGRIGDVLVGHEDLQLVGELLKNFQYNEMSAQVDLVSGGGLTLATKLHGRSPEATLNKQVNLNFNIDFNLWKFLESARLLTRIDQDVSEQILSNQKK